MKDTKRKTHELEDLDVKQFCSILASIALRVVRKRKREGLDGEMGKEPISPNPKGFSKKKR